MSGFSTNPTVRTVTIAKTVLSDRIMNGLNSSQHVLESTPDTLLQREKSLAAAATKASSSLDVRDLKMAPLSERLVHNDPSLVELTFEESADEYFERVHDFVLDCPFNTTVETVVIEQPFADTLSGDDLDAFLRGIGHLGGLKALMLRLGTIPVEALLCTLQFAQRLEYLQLGRIDY